MGWHSRKELERRRIHWLHVRTSADATKAKVRGYLTLRPPLNNSSKALEMMTSSVEISNRATSRD